MAREYDRLHKHYINNYQQSNSDEDIKLEDFIIESGNLVESKTEIPLISDNVVQDISLKNIKVENFNEQLEEIDNRENYVLGLEKIETVKEEIYVQNDNISALQEDPLSVDNQTHIKLEVDKELNLKENTMHSTRRKNNSDVVVCIECNKTFSYQYYYKIHVHSHAGNTPFKCDICEKSFVKLYLLKMHKLAHSEVRPYSCKICGRRFKRKSGVTRHQPVHSGNKHSHCDQCDKSFKSDYHLKVHKVSHETESSISCQQCEKSFPGRMSLQQHVRSVHLVKKLHICSYCGKEFNQKHILMTHLKTHID